MCVCRRRRFLLIFFCFCFVPFSLSSFENENLYLFTLKQINNNEHTHTVIHNRGLVGIQAKNAICCRNISIVKISMTFYIDSKWDRDTPAVIGVDRWAAKTQQTLGTLNHSFSNKQNTFSVPFVVSINGFHFHSCDVCTDTHTRRQCVHCTSSTTSRITLEKKNIVAESQLHRRHEQYVKSVAFGLRGIGINYGFMWWLIRWIHRIKNYCKRLPNTLFRDNNSLSLSSPSISIFYISAIVHVLCVFFAPRSYPYRMGVATSMATLSMFVCEKPIWTEKYLYEPNGAVVA